MYRTSSLSLSPLLLPFFFFGGHFWSSSNFEKLIGCIRLQIQAQDIRVGNIVWLRENDEVPCDLVLIGTSDPQGVCYVEVNIETLKRN